MAISYPITLPTALVTFRRLTIRPENAVGVGVSPYTFAGQAQHFGGERWLLDAELTPLARAAAAAWYAALTSLRGPYGSFLAGDTAYPTPRGIGTGTPLVAGGSQSGYTLATDGWTAGQTGILKAGDWIQLGTGSASRLHQVVADADSDGSGAATLDIWPALREAPGNNDPIVVSSPKGVFRLQVESGWSIDEGKLIRGLTLTASEVIDI